MSRLTESVSDNVDRMMKALEKAEAIVCPKCGYVYDDCEDKMNLVTFWGEDGPKEEGCPSCGHEFMVEEHVSRTYTVTEKGGES